MSCACQQGDRVAIEMWGEAKLDWQRRHIPLVQGIPSRDTFGRVFAALNQKQCEACSKRWMSGPFPALAGGRSWRLTAGPCVAHATRRARHYGGGLGMALSQVRTAEKSNEITVIPELLDALQLKGAIVTIERRYYVCSLPADAAHLTHVRAHWHIENNLH
ncbi:ISAs1 family transposase [Burkholderia pyrrocinia]|uniref:ISAs1 family transposase n=1 Tax=Burkholderia pyrrocinia TaxID=60550 RepID=UPI0021092900|nr:MULTISPECIES: ISAs1 family transposase [Burkholderia]